MKTILVSAIILGALFGLNVNAQNNLKIKVDGLENSKGTLMVALFNSEDTFLSPQAKGKTVEVTGETSEVIYENLPDGEYAIALFQDANNDKTLNLGEYGIPTEKYGFSNNIDPSVIKGMPSFAACKFEVKGDRTIEITAVYAIKQ